MSQPRSNSEVSAARALARSAAARLRAGGGLEQADPTIVRGLARDLDQIAAVLEQRPNSTPSAFAQPMVDARRPSWMPQPQPESQPNQDSTAPRKADATETIARRAGNLIDEIDFAQFVAGLVHSTFDAVVDAAIRQLESFADLISAVAKTVDQFVADNVSTGEAIDWLLRQHPQDLTIDSSSGSPRIAPKRQGTEDEPNSPLWLNDYNAAGEEITPELIEEKVIPAARRKIGEGRQQLLATMVLLGLNRIVVREGSITARVRFRAAATDSTRVAAAISNTPDTQSWSTRGSAAFQNHVTKVSTVGVNVQSDANLRADLFGEVKLTFASETLPLDRFVDSARMTLLQRNARPSVEPPNATTPPPALPPAAPPLAPAPVEGSA